MFSWFRQYNSPVVNQKQRLFGSIENAMMQTSQQNQGYMKHGEVLHLYGPHISRETLSTAIGFLQRRHPILRSRLQINPKTPDSYLLEEDDTLQLKIREILRKHTDHLIFWRQEWREQEKRTTDIGEGLAEFWLLQDPDDDNDDNSPQEIVIICEHSVSDGISLSTVAHELLIALSGKDDNMFARSLDWPIPMEIAIQKNLTIVSKVIALSRFIFTALYLRVTNTWNTAKLPIANVDFPLVDMCNYCHTESCYGTLNKEETQQLVEKCRREGVTVTTAVISAILCTASTLVKFEEDHPSALSIFISADTRRRCVPLIPNHDLSCQVACFLPFVTHMRNITTTSEGMWQLAKAIGDYMKTSIDAGHILALSMMMGIFVRKTLDPPTLTEAPTCAISSLGVLPFSEDYGRWKLMGMTPFVNIIRGVVPFAMLQTVNGILTIAYFGADLLFPISILEGLRDGTMQKLYEMIEH